MSVLLVVDGLPNSIGEDDLTEMCQPFGDVLFVRIVRDRYGKSLRYGYVEMATEHSGNLLIETARTQPMLASTLKIGRVECEAKELSTAIPRTVHSAAEGT